jgi:hypothetical protein
MAVVVIMVRCISFNIFIYLTIIFSPLIAYYLTCAELKYLMHINPAIVYAGGGLLQLPYDQADHSDRHTIIREYFTPPNGP